MKPLQFSNNINRRNFLAQAALGSAAMSLMKCSMSKNVSVNEKTENAVPLKILLLGGTSFLGPHQIKYALERGHSISTFTRGKSKPTVHADLLDQVESLIGDRENDLESLKNKEWDVVIDNSGRQVKWTEDTAELLKDNVKLYMYISSISVFYPYYTDNVKEDGPIVISIPEDVGEDEKYLYDYGVMKANSELAARRIFGDNRTIVVRPTFMTGPGDRTDRFMYWPTQLAQGGDIILPGKAEDPIQFIDVRDIAGWMIRLVENKAAGTYNGAGPKGFMNMEQFLQAGKKAFAKDYNFIKIDDYSFLEDNGLSFMAPYVMPREKFRGITRANLDKAISTGLSFRPVSETVKDTYDWWVSSAIDSDRRQAFETNPEGVNAKEKEIIEKWMAFQKK